MEGFEPVFRRGTVLKISSFEGPMILRADPMDFWFNILSSRFQAYQERGAAYASLGRFDEVDNVTSLDLVQPDVCLVPWTTPGQSTWHSPLKGTKIQGLSKPIQSNSAIYFYPGVVTHYNYIVEYVWNIQK